MERQDCLIIIWGFKSMLIQPLFSSAFVNSLSFFLSVFMCGYRLCVTGIASLVATEGLDCFFFSRNISTVFAVIVVHTVVNAIWNTLNWKQEPTNLIKEKDLW